jgi:hypothetical protein
MAVRFDAATDQLALASAPASTAAITVTAWAKNVEAIGNGTFLRLRAAGTIASFTASSGGTNGPQLATTGGTAGPIVGGGSGSLPTGSWRRIAVTINGTGAGNCVVYWGDDVGGATVTASGSVATGAPTALSVGGRGGGDNTERWGGDLAYLRVWTAVLSQAAIEAEWTSPAPVTTANLWADWPLSADTDLTDHSGNGRHLSAGSTAVTTVSGPPVTSGATLGVAVETSSALALVGGKSSALGVALETATALALVGAKTAALGVAVEQDTALPLGTPLVPGVHVASVSAPTLATSAALATLLEAS